MFLSAIKIIANKNVSILVELLKISSYFQGLEIMPAGVSLVPTEIAFAVFHTLE